jgi:hypothetical protein
MITPCASDAARFRRGMRVATVNKWSLSGQPAGGILTSRGRGRNPFPPSPSSRRARRGRDPKMEQFLALWFVLGAGHRCWPVWPGRMDRSGSDGASARLQHDSAGDVRQMRLRFKDSHRAAWRQLHSQPDRPCRRTLDDRPVATPSPRRQLIH